jgi:hypothetical protein
MLRGALGVFTFWFSLLYGAISQLYPLVQDSTVHLPWIVHQPDRQLSNSRAQCIADLDAWC